MKSWLYIPRMLVKALIKLAPPSTKDSIVHGDGCGLGITVGEILNLDFLTDFPLSTQPTALQPRSGTSNKRVGKTSELKS
jgi:hypothetical protein